MKLFRRWMLLLALVTLSVYAVPSTEPPYIRLAICLFIGAGVGNLFSSKED